MKERTDSSKNSYTSSSSTEYSPPDRIICNGSEAAGPSSSCRSPKASSSSSLWSAFLGSAFSVFDTQKKERSHGGWTAAVKRVIMNGGSMRRIQERVLGYKTSNVSNSTSDIWLLGVCYRICLEDPSQEPVHSSGYAAFSQDFSSRILMTYRKGFVAIGESKYTSDVNWGCMLRSSQMLVAQALVVHQLGRSWRKPLQQQQPYDEDYIEILGMFGDSEESPFSIHNLVRSGEGYGLAPGSWVGPYAMSRTWETLVVEDKKKKSSFPMAVYVVSGDEDGERGGAPVVCIEDASTRCSRGGQEVAEWSPMLLLVPLVLGLDKVNPRYLPLLAATFTFPQSLGILGGRPGASTYIIGVQDDKAFYLDPHDVQQAVDISKDNLEAVDTSSYHCNVIRQIPLESIDPSLAIGFYCRDKDDFEDFCSRASELASESNGAPLFTVTQTRHLGKQPSGASSRAEQDDDEADGVDDADAQDDWQLL